MNYLNEKWIAVPNTDGTFHIAPKSAFKGKVRYYADKVVDYVDEKTAKHICEAHNRSL